MINLTPTFLSEYHNISRGIPGNVDTVLNVPTLVKAGKKITLAYGAKAYLKNPAFPMGLYEYRRGKKYEIIN